MPTTIRGIPFDELEGSPDVEFNDRGITATRRFVVAWDQAYDFVQELSGARVDVGGQIVFSGFVPFPGGRWPTLVCEGARVQPFDPTKPDGSQVATLTNATNRYDNGALVTAIYRTLKFDAGSRPPNPPSVPGETFLTYDVSFGTQFMATPSQVWVWESGEPIDSDMRIAVLQPSITHHLTWHRVKRVPYAKISELIGGVNQNTFLGKGAETLLFSGARVRSEFRVSEESALARIEYNFQERNNGTAVTPYGWNYFYRDRAVIGTHWQKVKAAQSPQENPYAKKVDFSQLFQYG